MISICSSLPSTLCIWGQYAHLLLNTSCFYISSHYQYITCVESILVKNTYEARLNKYEKTMKVICEEKKFIHTMF